MANNQNQGFVSALKKYGVMKSDGQNMSDLLPAPAQQGTTVSNDMDTWVRSLPQGLSDAALNTYIYSNPDFKNNDTRKSAYEWYKEIYGTNTEEPTIPPLADSIGGMSGGMNEGQVRQALKGLGYESGDISDGWKLYEAEYGYDTKKAGPRAQNLAVRFPGRNSPLFDTWLQEVEDGKKKGYLTNNDMNWLLAMAEGWGSYYG